MKAIMKSIRPQHDCNILNLIKELEISTTAPKEWKDYLSGKTDKKPAPIEVYIYCTKSEKENLQYIWGYNAECNVGGKRFCILNKPQPITEKDKSRFDTEIFNEEDRKFIDEFAILTASLNGKVVAKFTLKEVEEITPKVKLGILNTYSTYETETLVINPLLEKCCLSYEELDLYLGWKKGYAWHIDNLVVFNKPKELDEFKRKEIVIEYDADIDFEDRIEKLTPLTRAPQSWFYVEV